MNDKEQRAKDAFSTLQQLKQDTATVKHGITEKRNAIIRNSTLLSLDGAAIRESTIDVRCYILSVSVIISRLINADPEVAFGDLAYAATGLINDIQEDVFLIHDITFTIDRDLHHRMNCIANQQVIDLTRFVQLLSSEQAEEG